MNYKKIEHLIDDPVGYYDKYFVTDGVFQNREHQRDILRLCHNDITFNSVLTFRRDGTSIILALLAIRQLLIPNQNIMYIDTISRASEHFFRQVMDVLRLESLIDIKKSFKYNLSNKSITVNINNSMLRTLSVNEYNHNVPLMIFDKLRGIRTDLLIFSNYKPYAGMTQNVAFHNLGILNTIVTTEDHGTYINLQKIAHAKSENINPAIHI